FLRAYDPSELLGDSGLAGKVELRYNLDFASIATTLYAYRDGGYVKTNKSAVAASVRQSVLSDGFGVRFTLPHEIKGYLELSKPRHK
ncbi:hypothetical protein ABTN38_20070, partial [Acinetobacter baumannii]